MDTAQCLGAEREGGLCRGHFKVSRGGQHKRALDSEQGRAGAWGNKGDAAQCREGQGSGGDSAQYTEELLWP